MAQRADAFCRILVMRGLSQGGDYLGDNFLRDCLDAVDFSILKCHITSVSLFHVLTYVSSRIRMSYCPLLP